jgi:4-hydroxy-3-polyprenylbenzoate decarboxylase
VPGLYTDPKTVDDIIDQTAGRVLDLYDIDLGDLPLEWRAKR